MKERYETLTPMIAGIVLAALALGAPAAATNAIYLKCVSDMIVTSGDLDRSSIGEELAGQTHPDYINQDYSLVLSYTETAHSTPQPDGSGSYDHAGLTIVRPTANSSPLFMKALFLGKVWPECRLEFYRDDLSDKAYLWIKIETVNVVQIEPRAVTQFGSAGSGKNHLEAITFTFKKITWSEANGAGPSFSFNLESGMEE